LAKSRVLTLEYLEARIVPSMMGLAWQDPTHLTLSFAPDGTEIAGESSVLFQTLNSQFPSTTSWQDVVAQAFQTWATETNVSIGLRTDNGAPFGVAGPMQGDPNFGDIRIGARPLSPDVMSITVPPDPYFSGTLSGDMILNNSADLNPNDLFDVALHEAGLALGLTENDDPSSVMYPVINPNASLSASDIQSIQHLYGIPAPDPNGSDGTFATATAISEPPLYAGTTPLVDYGDLTTIGDTNIFSVQPPLLYSGATTFQLQTSGISFMQPRLEIYNQNFQLVGEAQSTSELGDDLTVQLPNINPFERYYLEVDSPAQDVFGVGRYALSATYDGRSLVSTASLPAILSGPYNSLSAEGLAGLLADPTGVLLNIDLYTNFTFLTAEALASQPGYPASSQYDTVASLDGSSDVQYYQFESPLAPVGQTDVLTVTLTAMPVHGIVPIVSVYDDNTDPVAAQVLLNGNGTYLVQATGLNPGETYYLQVSAAPAPAGAVGNYQMVATFNGVPAQVQSFVGGTLSQSDLQDNYNLYVAQTQLFQFVLSTGAAAMSTDAQVLLQIFNSNGQLVFSLSAPPGDTVSGASLLLTPGQYQVSFSIVNVGIAAIPTIRYRLIGGSLSDPIGPAPADPTEEPMYQCPGEPTVNCYCYPGGTTTATSYEVS
jgi:hypothetical protein